MSYDLMVFDRSKAPETKEEFMKWFEKQTEWAEDHGYDDIRTASPDLRDWFMEMIKNFPPMNGEFAPEDEALEDNPELEMHLTDYTIGRSVIYAAFAWSVEKQARDVAKKLAMVYDVGFYDVSGGGKID
ncbi:hypothetical protein [Clostridium sp. AM58-1XD]|uniref:hypothetical protein n=1 Tax=Clostridium sp. AM58-1XD TaxID=2292307 RepID=UPI000E48E24C|nr:hypothetical protein [Clostridium sp. AM58-1XD]RGY97025.1 hypothetical protein DXA13_15615 [Clostridium sp. AM58-1XD]